MTGIWYNAYNAITIECRGDEQPIIRDALTGETLRHIDCEYYDTNKNKRVYEAILSPRTNKPVQVSRIIAYNVEPCSKALKTAQERTGKKSSQLVVDHINNNPHDNRPENLRWCTREENWEYAKHQPKYKEKPGQ